MDVKRINVKRIEPRPSKIIDEEYGYTKEEVEEQADLLKKFFDYLRESKERDMARLRKSGVIK